MSDDSYVQVLNGMKAIFEERAGSHADGDPYLFFLESLLPEATSLESVFSGEITRTALNEELQTMVQGDHTLADWLPLKVKIGFLSAFERDVRQRYRTRIDTFSGSATGDRKKAKLAGFHVEALNAVGDGGVGSEEEDSE